MTGAIPRVPRHEAMGVIQPSQNTKKKLAAHHKLHSVFCRPLADRRAPTANHKPTSELWEEHEAIDFPVFVFF